MGCTGAEMAGVAPSAFGGYVRTRLRLPKAQAGKTRNEAKTVNKPRDLFIIRFPFKDASMSAGSPMMAVARLRLKNRHTQAEVLPLPDLYLTQLPLLKPCCEQLIRLPPCEHPTLPHLLQR